MMFVSYGNFTIANLNDSLIFSSNTLPVVRWRSDTDEYELIDFLYLQNSYQSDSSVCQIGSNGWTNLFHEQYVPYVYFLKTNSSKLNMSFIDMSQPQQQGPPQPYLNIIACIPFKLGTNEVIITVCFCVLVLMVIIILATLHYRKVEEVVYQRHKSATKTLSLRKRKTSLYGTSTPPLSPRL
ncbi:unnamed protein product [Didymodactylos carnosus]|uniref:Uncharacterized protein n=2 Tax=Didymodactylos carnosus TaxID=1234261 RepID=A0A813WJI8_9BILA|nr:unnamed protein product [Didymodactylos carnosus]CAF3649991.1 unnamed protein product [Didymodactylos carnosus]